MTSLVMVYGKVLYDNSRDMPNLRQTGRAKKSDTFSIIWWVLKKWVFNGY
jgi:hypothetical protein